MNEPVPKPRPSTREAAEPAPAIYVFPDVLEELRFNAGWRDDRMAGGLLAGRRFLDPDTRAPYIEVEGFLAGTHVVDVGEFSRYLRVQWKAATAGLTYHFSGAEIVGWYLGVPDEERRPGPDEVALHETFFSQPWQRGLWVPARGRPVALAVAGGTFTPEVAVALERAEVAEATGT
ncbi:MAG: hypothetical protein H6706_21155 [Myxococcales bacterium]|nr:hypothetical protein [Myxococcales bacterium]